MNTILTAIGSLWCTGVLVVLVLCAIAQFVHEDLPAVQPISYDEAKFLADCSDVSAEIAYLEKQLESKE